MSIATDLLKAMNPTLWQNIRDCEIRKELCQKTVPITRALFDELREHLPDHVEMGQCDNCISIWPDSNDRQLVIMVMPNHVRFKTKTKDETYDLTEPDSILNLIASIESSL